MGDIRLHVTMDSAGRISADRATLIGRTGTGKSTLLAWLIRTFREEYAALRPRVLIMDTKPRWRAEFLADGTHAERRYKRMAQGDTLNGSMAIDRMQDWDLVWDRDVNPSQIVICQRIGTRKRPASHRANIFFQVMCAERFFSTQDARRPSIIAFDEGMDFFHGNAAARGGSDIVQRCYRAGREMGIIPISGFQRPVGINQQTLTEINYCAVFDLTEGKDVTRLYDMGWPHNVRAPHTEPYEGPDPAGTFRLWRGGVTAPKYRLALGEERDGRRRAS